MHQLQKIDGVSEIWIASTLLLEHRHGDFGQKIECQVVELSSRELTLKGPEVITPVSTGVSDSQTSASVHLPPF